MTGEEILLPERELRPTSDERTSGIARWVWVLSLFSMCQWQRTRAARVSGFALQATAAFKDLRYPCLARRSSL
jgi:hypothetical protein